jgi:hypothetical protein
VLTAETHLFVFTREGEPPLEHTRPKTIIGLLVKAGEKLIVALPVDILAVPTYIF